jgi:hypothetical protein
LSFKNLTTREIRAFDGWIIFSDVNGDRILAMPVEDSDPIKAGATIKWDGHIGYTGGDADKRLRSAEPQNLKTSLTVDKVFFPDGTMKYVSQCPTTKRST